MKKKKQKRIKGWMVTVLGLALIGLGVCAGIGQEKLNANPVEKGSSISTRADEPVFPEPVFPYIRRRGFTVASSDDRYGAGGRRVTGRLNRDFKDYRIYLEFPEQSVTGEGFIREDMTYRVEAKLFYDRKNYTEKQVFGVDTYSCFYVENLAGQRIYGNGSNGSTTPDNTEYTTQPGEQNACKIEEVTGNSVDLSFTLLGPIDENLNDKSEFWMRNLLEDKHDEWNGDLIWNERVSTFNDRTTKTKYSNLKPGTPYEFLWYGPQYNNKNRLETASVQAVTLLKFNSVEVINSSITSTSATITGKVEGRYFPDDDEGIKVSYRKEGTDDEWTTSLAATPLNTEGNETTFEISLSDLEVATKYEYRIQGYNSKFSISTNDWIKGSSGKGVLCQSELGTFETRDREPVESIKVIKYDDSTPRKPLKDAKFSLQWRDSGSSLWEAIGPQFESDENGVAEVPAESVDEVNTHEGQWKIVETEPPTGFEIDGNGETEIFTRDSDRDLVFEMVNKRKEGGIVTVNYFIENTETPLATSETLPGKYEEEWTAVREPVITKDGIEYTLKSAVFNNNPVIDVNTPVSGKFTLDAQTVTYYYESEDLGEITWNVPETMMNFGEVETPVRQAKDKFLQEKWEIVVSDTRQKNRKQWSITAKLTTQFTNEKGQKLAKNILKFKSTDGAVYDLSNEVEIYKSAPNPTQDYTSITSDSTSGFYLDLISNGYYPVGQYVGNVTFTLNTTP